MFRNPFKNVFRLEPLVARRGPVGRLMLLAATCIGVATALGEAIRADLTRESLEARFGTEVRPFLETYCNSCHARQKPKGDFDLRPYQALDPIIADESRWKSVLDQLDSAQMPPEEAERRPAADVRARVVSWIQDVRAFEGKRHAGDPGLVLARRLSNAEYDYSIRDLTGVDLRPAREFPVDPANTAGFDNSGESLTLSPSLIQKYLDAARTVTDHLLLTPDGFRFAPFPVLTETDRDRFCVRRIVDFYQRQPTNLSDYFFAAWQHRVAAAKTSGTDDWETIAAQNHLSSKYLAAIGSALKSPKEAIGPMAALQCLWLDLPSQADREAEVRQACNHISAWVTRLRSQVSVRVPNLHVPAMNPGAQAMVLWKDRQMASHRRDYNGNGRNISGASLGLPEGSPAAMALKPPAAEADINRLEDAYRRFCALFPDAFFISERTRVFMDGKEDILNTGRLLSAGLHNQTGYFRDDQPLYDLILDDVGRHDLDTLWSDFEFACSVPQRMHAGLIWFERSESNFISDSDFAFARAEDPEVISGEKFRRFAEVYLAKARRMTTDPTALGAIEEHFRISGSNLRRMEQIGKDSETRHLQALLDFARRAYRRPLTSKDRADIEGFYLRLRRDEGAGHEQAVRDTLVGILMSPYFSFRLDLPIAGERSASGGTEPLSDVSLASRLSYFLWASLPDAELLEAAVANRLHQPDVLLRQTQRLLKDPRVRGMATEFAGNWLDFRRFEEHNAVDRTRFPAFDHELRSAMFEEPIRLFLEIVQTDLSILDLLYADHTWVNAVLARHYGMPETTTDAAAWWSVDHASAYGRGGLIPMAVFQTRNSPGLRTSPVKRGYWVARRVLGEQIPPPPATVPELPGDESKLGELTLRQALERHRTDKACAGCHARFDSFGLALECYGPIGERRDNDLAGHPVDTHATLPGGVEADGLPGLKEYIRNHRQTGFVDNFCRKLLAYGLGRSLQLSDESTVSILRDAAATEGFRFSRLIEIIVTSPQFLNRRSSG